MVGLYLPSNSIRIIFVRAETSRSIDTNNEIKDSSVGSVGQFLPPDGHDRHGG